MKGQLWIFTARYYEQNRTVRRAVVGPARASTVEAALHLAAVPEAVRAEIRSCKVVRDFVDGTLDPEASGYLAHSNSVDEKSASWMVCYGAVHAGRVTLVSPSPRDLFARLSDDEKVAVDHVLGLELQLNDSVDGDARFVELVPDHTRRGYLKTIALQLRLLGCGVSEHAMFDEQQRSHQAYAEQLVAGVAARRREVVAAAVRLAEQQAEQQRRDDALPAAARRSLQRHRRRLERRTAR